MATSFLRFYWVDNVDGMAFAIGVSGVESTAGVGKIYTESIGGRGKLSHGVLPLPPFHCLPQLTREGFLLLSYMAHR